MILARVEWKDAKEAPERLRRRIFALTGKDPKMLGDIQRVIYRSTSVNFASKGRPQWAERSLSYQAWALKKYGTFWPPLLMTGKLFDTTLKSIQSPWQHEGKTHKLNIKSIWYGTTHQYGATINRNGKTYKIPKRKYILIQASEKQEVTAIIKKAMRGENG